MCAPHAGRRAGLPEASSSVVGTRRGTRSAPYAAGSRAWAPSMPFVCRGPDAGALGRGASPERRRAPGLHGGTEGGRPRSGKRRAGDGGDSSRRPRRRHTPSGIGPARGHAGGKPRRRDRGGSSRRSASGPRSRRAPARRAVCRQCARLVGSPARIVCCVCCVTRRAASLEVSGRVRGGRTLLPPRRGTPRGARPTRMLRRSHASRRSSAILWPAPRRSRPRSAP